MKKVMYMDNQLSGSLGYENVPVGTMFQFSSDNIPVGYLLCDGSAISRTNYAELFAVIGTTYGAGDGSTTFNLPDMRGKFAEGADATHILGATGGEAEVTLSVEHMPSHSHTTNSQSTSTTGGMSANSTGSLNHINGGPSGSSSRSGLVSSITEDAVAASSGSSNRYINVGFNVSHTHSFAHTHTTDSKGGDQPHNNLPPYLNVNYIIKYAKTLVQAESYIDDNVTTNSNVWSADKVNDEITDASKKFPDYAAGRIHTFSNGETWTCTKDCYFYDTTISATSDDSPQYHTKVNGVDITLKDSTSGSGIGGLSIYNASGYCKKGDKLTASARCRVYGLI